MPAHCPLCGADVTYSSTAGPVSVGTCESCGGGFTVIAGLRGTIVAPPPTAGDGETGGTEGEAGPTEAPAGPPCDVCGGTLTIAIDSDDGLTTQCGGCGKIVRYQPAIAPRGRREFDDRPPRRDSFQRDGFRRDGPGGSDRGPPRARPCRECGGNLRFSTDDQGNVVGECDSCGNKFTLPPRRDGEGGGGRGGRRPFDRGGGRGRPFGGRPNWRRDGPPRGGSGFGRRPRRDGDDDERPRRRRRDDE